MYETYKRGLGNLSTHLDGELLLLEVVHDHEELLVEHGVVAALDRLAVLHTALANLQPRKQTDSRAE
jgi:hypothetical protein